MQDKRNIENVVQEIMGLVDAYGTAVHDNSTGNPSNYTLAHAESAAYQAIESKLRELVREQEEKIRVAVARYNLASEIIESHSKERANNITKDS